MAALQQNLAESELFGHLRGSFTGADRDTPGLFERAHGGTLFFDEIGELPLELQPKMLRAIQEQRISRVGEIGVERGVDLRIVCATNRDLWSEVRRGQFREDLYFRLAVVPIHIPALRDRPEDIPDLARHFAQLYARQIGRETPAMDESAIERLLRHPWPGNVRELQNVMQRAVQFTPGGVISSEALRIGHLTLARTLPGPRLGGHAKGSGTRELRPLRTMVAEYIDEVLASVDQNVTHAARILEVSRKTIQRHLAERRGAPTGTESD
jgi:transcriptional regulator with GAF, ATPase, and Fis domain